MNNTKTHPEWVQVLYSKAILMSEILEDDEPELFFWTGVWHHPRTAKPSLVCSRTGVWSHLLPASRIPRWVLCTPGKPLPCTNFPASQMNTNVSSLSSPFLFSNLRALRPSHQPQPFLAPNTNSGFYCFLPRCPVPSPQVQLTSSLPVSPLPTTSNLTYSREHPT